MATYKIIGADGKEYGPIAAEQLKQWFTEGRVNAQTQVLAEGSTDWKPLGEFPELAATVTAIPTAAPTYAAQSVSTDAGSQVNGPAIGLIVTAVIGFIATVIGTIWNMVAAGAGMGMNQPGMNPEMERFVSMFSGTMGIVSGIIGLVVAGLILFGALKMKKLESYGWAMTSSILAMIPCISPCCLLGLPIGIWALVVLAKPEVKSSFR
ncbi:MAG: DUF4339 domain-containing protein [Verrucomicrobia bacterium]|nr:DUF4339 domain-containing protein [Verrucomicrobiota bacterium]